MRSSRALVVAGLVAGSVVVPVVSFPALGAPGGSDTVTDVPLSGVDEASLPTAPDGLVVAPADEAEHPGDEGEDGTGEGSHEPGETEVVPTDAAPEVLTEEVATGDFTAVAFTWDAGTGTDGVVVQVRVREDHGWSEWYPLPQSDDGPDEGSLNAEREGERASTDLLLTSGADAVQVRADAATDEPVQDLRAVLIDPAVDTSSTPVQSAGAATQPGIIIRAQWGAGSTPTGECAPTYSSELKAAVIHHTVSTNSYTPQQSAGLVKSIWLYHTRPPGEGGRGWCDIGYNVLVDRYGQIFEGAAGGVDRNVIGAHAGGFNTYTVGVSTIGNFETAAAPAAMTESIAQFIAWRLELAGVNPGSTTQLRSAGGGTARYPAGTVVTLPVIMGHRDVGSTACPGQNLYDQVGAVRARVAQLVGDAGSSLLRTVDNATVYLVTAASKYVVPDMGTLESLAPLGAVGFVSQQYLDRRPTAAVMSRVVLSPDGTVYFLDSGIKLPFGSCGQVADYGASCDTLVKLDQWQVNSFHSGPMITPLYMTTTGKLFHVTQGTKRQIVDDVAVTQAGLPMHWVTLKEAGLAHLPYGPPLTRDGIAVRNIATGAITVRAGGGYTTVPESIRSGTSLAALPVRNLDDGSVRWLSSTTVSAPLVKEPSGPRIFLLTERGKRHVTSASMIPASVPTVSAAFLGLFPDAGTMEPWMFLKGSGSGTVYVLGQGIRRPVVSWPDLVALNGGNPSPAILSVDQRVADALPVGAAQLGQGALVYSPRNATVFFVNGLTELIPVNSLAVTNELGATWLRLVSDASIDAYTVRGSGLGTAVDCAGTRYLGIGGRLYHVGSAVGDEYDLTYFDAEPLACSALPKAGELTRFLRAASGTIYYIENGTKRPIGGYGTYVGLGGTAANTISATDFSLSLIPTGAVR